MHTQRDESWTPRTQPTLSVVIPTRDRVGRLTGLLDEVRRQAPGVEVVVVDDGSGDGTRELLDARRREDPALTVVDGPRSGPMAARVAGARRAAGSVLLLLDDDVTPAQGLVEGHRRHHAGGPDLVVLGYMPTRTGPRPDGRACGFTTALYAAEYEGRAQEFARDPRSVLTNLWMGNVSVRRERFIAVTDGWPAPLPRYRHEDQDIGLRLRDTGSQAVFDRDLLAHHHHERDVAQFRRDCRLDGAGLADLDEHHPDRPGGVAGVAGLSHDLPAPLRRLVEGADAGPVYAGATAGLTLALRLTEGRAAAVQLRCARLLRRIELRRGYLRRDAG